MTFRIINVDKNNKLEGVIKTKEATEMMKILHYCQKNEIAIQVNTEDIVDTDGDEFYILEINPTATKIGGGLCPYISVYVH